MKHYGYMYTTIDREESKKLLKFSRRPALELAHARKHKSMFATHGEIERERVSQ